MSLDEIIKVCPGIEKVTLSCYREFLGDDFDQHKTWSQMGLDDLDIVEMVMSLEKKHDFEFPDNLLDEVFGENTKPINFIGVVRQRKLNDLGI